MFSRLTEWFGFDLTKEVFDLIFLGDDWAEGHHDVHLMDTDGRKLAARRLPEGLPGITVLHELVAAHADDPAAVIVGIETDRGVWVQALVAAGYQVYAINPLAASRYRDRHQLSGAKSNAGDAKMLADLVRTDRHNHRQVAGDTDAAEAIKVLARAHQNLIWARNRSTNMLRSALREFYPAALEAFDDLSDRDALSVLTRAPDPERGSRLSLSALQATLKRAGRQRNIESRAREIQTALRTEHLSAPPQITAAFAAAASSHLVIIGTLNTQIAEVEAELASHFEKHPDADIYLSLPGFGVVLGARVLGEFGDDAERYACAKSRRNYAGTSPITIASGKRRSVLARHVRNRRLYDALDQAAFCALRTSPGARAFYDHRRASGDLHHQALRVLANRLVGILHGCLASRTRYNEHNAWAHRSQVNREPSRLSCRWFTCGRVAHTRLVGQRSGRFRIRLG